VTAPRKDAADELWASVERTAESVRDLPSWAKAGLEVDPVNFNAPTGDTSRPASAEAGSLRKPTIDQRFMAWLEANPDVYPTIVGLAREAKTAGKRAIGMKALWEVARWTLSMRTRGDDYRWNNDYTAPMARLIQEREPDLAHMFETRRRRS